MKKLAIVSLNDHVSWGGSEVLWSQVGERFLHKGNVEIAISPKKWNETPTRINGLLDLGAADYRRLEPRVLMLARRAANAFLSGGFKLASPVGTFRILSRFKPDLVLISLGDHNTGQDWTTKCRELGIPYVLIVQLVKEGHYPISGTRFYQELRDGYRGAKWVLCTSHDNKFLLEKQFASDLPNALVIDNPILQPSVLPPYPEGAPAQWAMVASLNPNHKGQDILFDVLRDSKWRNRDLEVNLYGSGPHEALVRDLASHWKLENVRFHGHVPIEKIWSVNQLLVMPTRMEGLSLAFLEAMNCERAAIITQLGDAKRFIEDNVTGFLVKAPQADLLDEAMERAWQRRDDWKEIGRRARVKLHQEIPEDTVSRVVNLIEAVLNLTETRFEDSVHQP